MSEGNSSSKENENSEKAFWGLLGTVVRIGWSATLLAQYECTNRTCNWGCVCPYGM